MKHLKNILKGCAIGVANVIPGFSGGTMAVIMGVYDLFVDTLGNLFSHPIQSIKKGWSLFLGVLLGILLALLAIVKLLDAFPVPTMFFFIGITVGTLPSTLKNLEKDGRKKPSAIISFALTALFLLVLQFLNPSTGAEITVNFGTYVVLFLLGVVCASAMVLPGVSGSLLLMLFGYYTFLMGSLDSLVHGLIPFDFAIIKPNLLIFIVFALGAVLGIVGCSKLVSWLLKRFPLQTQYAIGGLLTVSPIVLMISLVKNYGSIFPTMNFGGIVICILAFALGMALLLFYNHHSDKAKNKLS